MRRVNSLNRKLVIRELGVVVHNQHVEDPLTGAKCHLEDDQCGIRRRVGRAR